MKARQVSTMVLTGAAVWLVARLWVAYQFLNGAKDKWFGSEFDVFLGAHAGTGVRGYLTYATSPGMTGGANPSVLPVYQWLARNVFIPHATVFGVLVALGEATVGLALLVGLATRFAAATGALINLMFLLAGTTGVNPYMFTIELSMVLAGTTAGYFGLDYFAQPAIKAALAKMRTWGSRQAHTPHFHLPGIAR